MLAKLYDIKDDLDKCVEIPEIARISSGRCDPVAFLPRDL